ncbi:MAG TPA: PAS domain-containing sensor histidine kinase [Ramlibacter sp.]|nr:PAS domain-containing sensor histidine kinase [Ramlibacter sp.]
MDITELDFTGILHASPNPYVVLDRSLNVVSANPAYLAATQREVADIQGRSARHALPTTAPEALRQSLGALERVVRTGEAQVVPALPSDALPAGAQRYWDIVYSPVKQADGELAFVLQQLTDVTALQDARAALHASESRFNVMANALPQIVWITDAAGNIEFLNRYWFTYTGRRPQAATVDELTITYVHPDDTALTLARFAHSQDRGETFEVEHRLAGVDGVYRWFLARAEPYRDPATGAISRWFGSSTDIDDRRRAEERLRITQERQMFLMRVGDVLGDLQAPGDIQAAATRLLGQRLDVARAYYGEYDEEADRGTVHSDYRRGSLPSVSGVYRISDFTQVHELLRRGNLVAIEDVDTALQIPPEERTRLRKLKIRSVLAQPLVKAGKLVAAFLVDDDMPRHWTPLEANLIREAAERTWAATERARAENALRAANRRKDEFLATLAHELRNPLAPLRNGIEIARLTGGSDERALRNVEMMDRQLTHLVRLVNDLLEVGRVSSGKLELRLEPIKLQRVLTHSVEAVQTLLDAQRLRLERETPAGDGPWLMGDHDRLAQVFINLLTNAIKYTEPGGCVTLSTHIENDNAVVRVRDTGIGIPAQELSNVFDLFSQVRSHQAHAQGGLGIGLSLVRSIVNLHDGRVSVDSEGPGQGSTFTVRLPVLAVADHQHAP